MTEIANIMRSSNVYITTRGSGLNNEKYSKADIELLIPFYNTSK